MSSTWGLFWNTPAEAPALAFVTTIHCSIAVLRKYRPLGDSNLLLLPSFFLVTAPWFLSTPAWLVIAIASHLVWFIACEKLVPPRALPVRAAVATTRTAPPVAQHAIAQSERTEGAASRTARKQFHELPVLAIHAETPEIRTFRFRRPPGFAFAAGQFVMVKATIDGKPVIRCYSISSPPSATGYLEISVRRQGRMSAFLHEHVRPGTVLHVSEPGGKFVYPAGSAPIVLLAGGIGITPLLSMLQHAVETEPQRRVTLILSARSRDLVPFRELLKLLAARHPQFRLAVTLSGGCDTGEFLSGRIDRAMLTAVVESIAESEVLICGPAAMIGEMREAVASLEVPSGRIHFEKFESASAGAELRDRGAAPQVAPEIAVAAAAHSHGNGNGNGHAQALCVRLQQRGRIVPVAHGQSILEAAESAGEELPSLCREGVCGTCRVRLTEGNVEGDFDGLDERDRADGIVLACVARPVTNCAVDA